MGRVQMPLSNQPIRGKSRLQTTRGYTIEIHVVATNDGPQLVDIQIRVLDLQRIKGPFHQAQLAGKRFNSLLKLELSAQSTIAIGFPNSEHMGMQVGPRFACSSLHSGQRHGETDEGFRAPFRSRARQFGVECAEDLPADLLPHEECFTWDDIAVVVSPCLNLELNTCLELVESGAIADENHGW